MKLDEVAAPKQLQKCGLVVNKMGEHSLDYDGFTNIAVFTSQRAFIEELKDLYLDLFGPDGDEGGMSAEEVAQLKRAKTMGDLAAMDAWDEFLGEYWVDDRF